jgi:predicted ArsR family transcriptional regulator
MNQIRKKQILDCLATGGKTVNELTSELALSKGQVNFCLRPLLAQELIEVKGLKPLDRGFGNERIFGLYEKKKAINAFDWRNWETQCHQSAREIAYSHSAFDKRNDGRVIVYSKA